MYICSSLYHIIIISHYDHYSLLSINEIVCDLSSPALSMLRANNTSRQEVEEVDEEGFG